MSVKPDKFQQAIYKVFTNTNNNVAIQAVAGSGKTTVLIGLLDLIPPSKDAIYVAFNRHIVESMKTRFTTKPNVTISTLNSFGARMLYKSMGSIALVENKYFLIALRLFKNSWGLKKENKWSYCYTVSKIIDVMRFNYCFDDVDAIVRSCEEYGITILGDELEHALQVFEIGLKDSNKIDFLDQVFMSVVRKIKFKKFDYVLCDEIQDFSKLQHQFIKKLLGPRGRLIGVGDKFQSIYYFAGASSNSFEAFKQLVPNMIELPLSFCYRCGHKMVELAQHLVPQIQPHPKAIPGLIEVVNSSKGMRNQDAVLCRLTKPLVLLCRDLIRQGKKAVIKGREIGENLLLLIKKTRSNTIDGCIAKINQYETELRVKLLKKGVYRPEQHKAMLQLVEKKEIIKILGYMCGTIPSLIKRINQIFVEETEDGIMLMTIHKAKGLEFDRVWLLNSELIPHPMAITKEELQQEWNLMYVAITRAKKELRYLSVEEDEDGQLYYLDTETIGSESV